MIFAGFVMPIYAYRCESCGFAKDALQKVSDPQLTICPSCNQETFKKQVTAAGFQLKGTGWYVTDFRGGNSSAPAPKSEGESKAASPATTTSTEAKSDTAAKSDSSSSNSSTTAPASTTTASD